ncbi:phosphohistidine phosphatase SixA [Paraglaciecola arctica]|uniref:phosphohistidine phosphatase SixA n=1 Tax=Paraglaciecola arctica TaxID=1128911 RepID=UPI001C069A1B|nr:phosphohistidine phosphatase SixA [Paraglaciecola arctica]MBU3002024.1 phosphohistidine phosphatase SixA [Paraglaciecola arctica]
MKLIIMRHGEAETFRVQDKTRSLTIHGEKQAKDAGKWLANYLGADIPIDLALTSSYVRAQQTKQKLSSQVTITETKICDDVTPDGDPKVAHDFVRALIDNTPSINVFIIVSHMPFVSYFLEEVHRDKQTMLFDTSSLVVLDYDANSGTGVIENIYHPV